VEKDGRIHLNAWTLMMCFLETCWCADSHARAIAADIPASAPTGLLARSGCPLLAV